MKKPFILFLFFIFNLSIAQVQSELFNYKYILIPTTFSFQDAPHEYNLNRLTQFLFNKYNFETFIEGEENLLLEKIDPCEILRANAFAQGFFKTKVSFTFLDCRGKLIYTSHIGTSSKKEFDKSYNEAIRNVFKEDRKINTHTYLKNDNVVKKNIRNILPLNSLKGEIKLEANKASFEFKLRSKTYNFVQKSATTYIVLYNLKEIGKITQQSKNKQIYSVDAGVLSGTGSFDDFGNFRLKRVNPINQQELIDVMVRTK